MTTSISGTTPGHGVDGLIERLSGGLIVSCQAYPGEPLDRPGIMPLMARAVVRGGARAVRLQGLENIREAAELPVPVIGLVKEGDSDVYITPTLELALAVAAAGAQVVALDGTARPRPDGLSLRQTIDGLRERHDVVVMADCDCLESALGAVAAGADIVGTTLAGYTGMRPRTDGPDLALIEELALRLPGTPLLAEGRIHTVGEARAALEAGAMAVVVGTAITHPTSLTETFARALE